MRSKWNSRKAQVNIFKELCEIPWLDGEDGEEISIKLKDVAKALDISKEEVEKVCKNLTPVYGEYYKMEDIVRALQGGKLYE